MVVHDGQVELRLGVALSGGLAVPGLRLHGVLQHALSLVVHDPEVELRIGEALVGGLSVPDCHQAVHIQGR